MTTLRWAWRQCGDGAWWLQEEKKNCPLDDTCARWTADCCQAKRQSREKHDEKRRERQRQRYRQRYRYRERQRERYGERYGERQSKKHREGTGPHDSKAQCA
jgi:hypothetical protein